MSTIALEPKPRKKTRSGGVRRGLEIGILSVPALAFFLMFVIFPVVMALYYGLYHWQGFGTPQANGVFAGLQNFITILTSSDFQQTILHNFLIAILSLVFQGPLSILFALLLNRKFKGRGLIRTLIFVPYVISEVIIGTGWSLMLMQTGAINDLLHNLHILGDNQLTWIDWTANPSIALWTLMIVITWKYIGFAVILMLAGMQSIPEELYEAAKVDGASYWQMQWRITLPLLAPTIRIWAFLSIIGSFQLFDLVYVIWGQTNSQIAGVSTMATFMYAHGFKAQQYGYGSAVAFILFIITLIVALCYQHFVLNRDLEGALTEPDGKKGKKGKRGKSKKSSQSASAQSVSAQPVAMMERARQ